jgi:nicotinate-nucleotide adenylyltransferase
MGGTFDPIHDGHLAIAAAARDELGLERVVFVPAGQPPHRPAGSIAPAEDRLAMVRLAVAGRPGFEVSRIELDRPGPSYTADTLEALVEIERAAGRTPDLVFILSAETFGQLPTWHEPERILRAARLAVVPRAGHQMPDAAWLEAQLPGRASRILTLGGRRVEVSGTQVRDRVAAGLSLDGLVPPAVASYISEHGLYRAAGRSANDQPLRAMEGSQPVPEPATSTRPAPPSPNPEELPNPSPEDLPSPDGLPRRAAPAPAPTVTAPVPTERSALDLARRVVELAEDKKAADIVLLDLAGLTTLADHFVICSGGSERQIEAIADGIVDGLRAEKVRPIGREGTAASHWVLVDFGTVIVHVFTPPERDYYQLERHWSEARTVLRVQ